MCRLPWDPNTHANNIAPALFIATNLSASTRPTSRISFSYTIYLRCADTECVEASLSHDFSLPSGTIHSLWYYRIISSIFVCACFSTVSGAALHAFLIASQQISPALAWPTQSFKTTNFTSPALKISRSGLAEQGLLFFAPLRSPPIIVVPLIMSVDDQLVWHGPIHWFPTAARGFQVRKLGNNDGLTYWNGTSYNVSQQRGYAAISIFDNNYTENHRVFLGHGLFVTTDNATYDSYLDVYEDLITDRGTIVAVATNVTRADSRFIGGPQGGWILTAYSTRLISRPMK